MGSFVFSSNKADELNKKRAILQAALESYSWLNLKNYVGEPLYILMCKCDEDKESYRDSINLSPTEHELLFSSIKASKGSDIAGTA